MATSPDSTPVAGRVLAWFTRQGLGRPWTVIALSAFIATAGFWLIRTHLTIDPDLKALLPPDYASVTRLETLQDRIGTQSDLIVSIESPDREANLAFGRLVAERLEGFEELRYVMFRRNLDFFHDHALLYLPMHELLELRQRVIDRIRKETESDLIEDVAGDSGADSVPKGQGDQDEDDWLDRDPDELVADYLGGGEVPSEYLEADEGRIVVVKARPVELTTNVEFSRTLVSGVRELIAELDPTNLHPDMKADVRGEYLERVGESKSVGPDVILSALFAIGLLMGLIALYFRRIRAVIIVVVPIVLSTVATLGVGAVMYGTFNIVTTFIFAILLGLGIDFGIHALSRYRHERDAGKSHADAMALAVESTGAALLFGAVTTAAVFFLLRLGHFQGFAQFGVMAGIGVVLGLVATFALVPAMTTVLERVRPWKAAAVAHQSHEDRYRPVRGRRALLGAWAVVLVSALVGGWSLYHARDIGFENDFRKLGPKEKANPDADPDKKDYRDAVGRVTTYAPAVALCDDVADCESLTRLLQMVDRVDDLEWTRLWTDPNAPAPNSAAAAAMKGAAPSDDGAVDPLADDDPFGEPGSDSEDALAEDDPFGDPATGDGSVRALDRQAEELAARLAAELRGGALFDAERDRLRGLGEHRVSEMREYLRGFMGLHVFVPDRQEEKLALIADVLRRIDRKREALDAKTRERVDQWYRYLTVRQTVTAERLPRWVVEQLRETDGRIGAYTIVWNGGSKANYDDAKRLHDTFFDMPVEGGKTVPMAANYFVLVQVIDTLNADGPVVISAAVIAVLLSLFLLFRSIRAALFILVPLILSIGWLGGLYMLLGWKLNMFSVVAFPLIVGMGIDDGIHIYHRWKEVPRLRAVLIEVGGAVFMTTVTTCIGFAGLLFANHQGIQTLGITGGLGMILALVASVVSLPALLYLVQRMTHPQPPVLPASDA